MPVASIPHTIVALVRVVECRDAYTGNHSQRVTAYSLMLAEEMKLSKDAIETLRLAVPLHDIGKIGVPDHILRKKGKLTAAEFAEMKLHTVKGEAILQSLVGMKQVLPIVRNHHERWDGRGYPDGLKGNKIPPLARLVAVADAFDAMTSTRVYRPALTVDAAFAEIAAQAGKQFDPQVAQAMLRIRPQIEDYLLRSFLSRS